MASRPTTTRPVPVHSPTPTLLCSRSELAAGRRPPPACLRAPCLADYSPSTPPAWIRASSCPSPHAGCSVHRGQTPSPQTSPARRPPVTLPCTTAARPPTVQTQYKGGPSCFKFLDPPLSQAAG